MKTFLAIYIGGLETMKQSGWESMAPEKRKALESEGMMAWGTWMNTHKNSVIVAGGPLGKTKGVSAEGITSVINKMCGYVLIKASSHEEAANMFIDHPPFFYFSW